MTDLPGYWSPAEARHALALLDRFETAVIMGARAPQRHELKGMGISDPAAITLKMARAGLLRIEIYGRNFRRIFLCHGPHAGSGTAPAPVGWKPYKVIGPERPA
jgi:hypothetical protein